MSNRWLSKTRATNYYKPITVKFFKMILCGIIFFCSCSPKHYRTEWTTAGKESAELSLIPQKLTAITPGIPVYDTALVTYKRGGALALKISFSEPVIVTMANEPQAWGNYQFPTLSKTIDGALVAKTHLSPDAVASYGKTRYIYSYSHDKGKHWVVDATPGTDVEDSIAEGVLLKNGDRIKILTPPSINESNLQLPQPVAVKGTTKYYHLNQLPESRQGVFYARMKKGDNKWMPEKAALLDDEALRYSTKSEMPVVWWGDIKIAADGSLIAGIYPGYMVTNDGKTDLKSGIFFYRSTDDGRTWKIQGRIPYAYDKAVQPAGENFGGFTEPSFEILADGSFLCVMRTTDNDNGPMYASRSNNLGISWTKPQTITPAGVLPRLLRLNNGVLVLSSGRPGVQLRFAMDGTGKTWTQPFEMLKYDMIPNVDWFTSCGYTNIMPVGGDSFYLIYSDFFTMNTKGQMRKSIKFRKITVTPIQNN